MFENKHTFKFICTFLGILSVFIDGPLIPIISFAIAIALFVYKIKLAKESPEGFSSAMLDILIIVIVIIVDIGFFALRISIENDYNYYTSGSSEKYSTEELVEFLIGDYKIKNLSQFSNTQSNNVNEIRKGFKTYLQEQSGFADVTVKGNKIACNFGMERIIFTITNNNITYEIK